MPTPADRTREKVRQHRLRLRAEGLRPVQLWVPDARAPAFRQAAHDQALAVGRSSAEHIDQEFIDAISNGA